MPRPGSLRPLDSSIRGSDSEKLEGSGDFEQRRGPHFEQIERVGITPTKSLNCRSQIMEKGIDSQLDTTLKIVSGRAPLASCMRHRLSRPAAINGARGSICHRIGCDR
jgi:hypothetical protein